MKKYIILLGAIRNVGGAQAYTANKLKYMEEKGWEPHAFFFVDGEITINYQTNHKLVVRKKFLRQQTTSSTCSRVNS